MGQLNKKGIPGIPYFGVKHNKIETDIKSSKVSFEKEYDSLYELIQEEKGKDKIVLISYNDNEWLSYLRDIKFNYRDGLCFIPFYTYDIKEIDEHYKSSYKGHILKLSDETIGIRYNYCLRQQIVDLEHNSFVLYDLEKECKYQVKFKKWYSFDTFDIDELYQLYIDYLKNFEDNLIHKHTEGYHIVSKNVYAMDNAEKKFREKYKLKEYLQSDVNIYYRDVRNLSEEAVISKFGVDFCDKPYWERKLDFESFLYCILHSGAVPNNDFKLEWNKLGKSKEFIKYGNEKIKLIFKSYWLPNCEKYKRRSWSRI